jgi:hypothetical protein
VKVDEDGAQIILSMANLEVKGGKLNILTSLQMLSSNCKYDNNGSLLYKKDAIGLAYLMVICYMKNNF